MSRYPAALKMTLHYFQLEKLEVEQEERLRTIFAEAPDVPSRRISRGKGHRSPPGNAGCFTPAVVEQVASEHESVDDFISALELRI